jgi:hypothetical protein
MDTPPVISRVNYNRRDSDGAINHITISTIVIKRYVFLFIKINYLMRNNTHPALVEQRCAANCLIVTDIVSKANVVRFIVKLINNQRYVIDNRRFASFIIKKYSDFVHLILQILPNYSSRKRIPNHLEVYDLSCIVR